MIAPPPWPRPAPSSQWQGGCRSLCQLTRVSRAGAAATRFPQPNVEHVKKQHTTRLRGVREGRARPSRVPEIYLTNTTHMGPITCR